MAPVKNAISHPESSGFVEGNNNKFKLIKRIVYGRSGLVNLSKK
ncbi:MAG: transposase, partial [Ruminococcus sp.]|nr:transposase [Ruminococcus sp.]